MRAVTFLGNRKLELTEFPDPAPGPGEVVLDIKASGMCGSDLKFYRASGGAASLGLGKVSGPIIAGHEPCGVVAAVGPGVAEIARDRVVVQVRILGDDPDASRQARERRVLHVNAVDPNRALSGFVDARDQHRHRGLPSPRRADERDRAPGRDRKRDVPEHPRRRRFAVGRGEPELERDERGIG